LDSFPGKLFEYKEAYPELATFPFQPGKNLQNVRVKFFFDYFVEEDCFHI
jgi:hypothetical protein